MSSDETAHQKIFAFLSGEFAKKDERQCLRVDLEYAPLGFRAEKLRSWVRADHPQYFEELVFVEQLVATIVELAEADADASGSGARPYLVRTHEQVGTRYTCKFRVSPSYDSSDQALAVAGGTAPTPSNSSEAAMQILSGNNRDLMRITQSMHTNTFGALANMANDMRDENSKLRQENFTLRRENDDLRSGREEKELEQMIRVRKNEQSGEMTAGLLNIGKAIAARVIGGDMSKPGADPSPILSLLADFTKSLTQDQVGKLLAIMRQDQQVMLFSLMDMALPKKQGGENKSEETARGALESALAAGTSQ